MGGVGAGVGIGWNVVPVEEFMSSGVEELGGVVSCFSFLVSGWWAVSSGLAGSMGGSEHGTGKSREPADRNVCATSFGFSGSGSGSIGTSFGGSGQFAE